MDKNSLNLSFSVRIHVKLVIDNNENEKGI